MDRIDCLRAFVRTLEGGSFSAAAKELGIGQPAISKRIALLEGEFGTQLFLRTTRKLKPTAEAHRIYDLARQILEQLRHGAIERRTGGAAPHRHTPDRRAVVVRATLHDAGHRRICPELSGSAGRHPLQRALRQSGRRRHRTGAGESEIWRRARSWPAGSARCSAISVATPTYLQAADVPTRTPGRSERTSVHRLFRGITRGG